MKTMNTVAFILVLLWVAGWTIAAIRAGFTSGRALCPARRKAPGETAYDGS